MSCQCWGMIELVGLLVQLNGEYFLSLSCILMVTIDSSYYPSIAPFLSLFSKTRNRWFKKAVVLYTFLFIVASLNIMRITHGQRMQMWPLSNQRKKQIHNQLAKHICLSVNGMLEIWTRPSGETSWLQIWSWRHNVPSNAFYRYQTFTCDPMMETFIIYVG